MPKSSLSTILVVDDNLGARRSIEALLTQENYRFLLADSGAAALQLLESHTPDVILLDVMMPGMNGFEVCQKIRSTPSVSEIPIIMITALDDEESMIQGIDAGADDFLSKPISKIELRSRIRSILRLNRFRKLCDERQKFELVVAQSHRGYVVIDENKRIISSNTAAKNMLQIGDDGEQEHPHFFDTARKNFTIQPNNIEQTLDDENAPQLDPFILVRSVQNDQAARWIRVTFQDIGLTHSHQHFLRLEDISDRIVSFQEKHTFSRMITHKLLTPLNAIKAAHQLLDTNDTSPERLAQIHKIQKKGIDRLEYDIHSILSFLESERNPRNFLTIADAHIHIQRLAETSPFHFKVHLEDEFASNDAIQISGHGFDACLREIVENAIKFHRGATVSINCYIRKAPHSPEVQILFQNNSYPLTKDELANAWKPYWQADRYVTGEISGMGLGLSLIAANIWTAGGTCKIENHPPTDGVQLTLTLPIRPQ
ncbi:response regulator [Pelagicoccus sp. SDUM812005]|uniref:ATP-binding response regulator n=1 Tax=Pelagicoccus sp. SDUM812005 TaxID=3041257 RepID=UPI00280C6CF3|nr:response regulator [Pelagicoccus sp. SDUM812005]MDQ8180193.1 response regulator [Pelagicoccus sp. SDUM812005]